MELKTIEDVIAHLKSEVYVRLKRSPIAGIGVFAIREIPAGIDPFQEKKLGYKTTAVSFDAVMHHAEIHPNVKKYVDDVCSNRDGILNVPVRGINSVTVLLLMNHSETPNIRVHEDRTFTSMRVIGEGEELTINYHVFNDHIDLG